MSDKFTISLPVFNYCLLGNGRHEVTENSDSEVREALERFARYFKAEFGYDDVQYYADEHDKNCIGFLFTEPALDASTWEQNQTPTRCSGGCCFRKVRFKNEEKWVLYWVWLHPYFRNRQILSKHWQFFLSQFNDFLVEQPLSRAMQSFIDKKINKACV